MKTCGTSNREVTSDYVSFNCPKCAQETITRSMHARATSKSYTCTQCGFSGP